MGLGAAAFVLIGISAFSFGVWSKTKQTHVKVNLKGKHLKTTQVSQVITFLQADEVGQSGK